MASMSSSQFRLIYASLTEPTTVTVNGHPLGTWVPSVVVQPEALATLDSMSYSASTSGDPYMTINAVQSSTSSLAPESVRFGAPTPAQKPPPRPHVSRGNMKRSRNKESG